MVRSSRYTATPAAAAVAAIVATVDDVIAASNTNIVNEAEHNNNGNNDELELELDFPEEKVKDLLVELYQIFANYLYHAWTTLMNLVKEIRIDISSKLFDGYHYGINRTLHYSTLFWEFGMHQIPHTWKERYHNIYAYVCEKENYYWFQLLMEGEVTVVFQIMKVKTKDSCLQIGNHLIQFPSMIHELYHTYYHNQSKWVKLLLLLVMCYGLYHFSIVVRRWYRRRQKRLKKKNRRVHMKKGHSEIVHGRTSLLYGAAGELREEEYLEDSDDSEDDNTDVINRGQGRPSGRGRFSTFDFFGMNGPTTASPKRTKSKSNRKRNQSSWDDSQDHMFGVARRRSSSIGT